MEKQPISASQIRYQDCDPLGHLNNGRYIDYFMNAREDHLALHYNLHIYDRFRQTGKTWVVAKSEIIYRAPANLMEMVQIRTQVNHFSIKHIEVEMAMYDNRVKQLKALLRSVFIPFDVKTGKSTEHDPALMELLKIIHVEGITRNIEERIAELEGSLKTV